MDALSQMVDEYETQLKFVVTDESDLPEITDLVDRVRAATATTVADDDVLLMPEGMTREQLDGTRSEVAELAMEYGYRYTPRLHVDLWNDAPGNMIVAPVSPVDSVRWRWTEQQSRRRKLSRHEQQKRSNSGVRRDG